MYTDTQLLRTVYTDTHSYCDLCTLILRTVYTLCTLTHSYCELCTMTHSYCELCTLILRTVYTLCTLTHSYCELCTLTHSYCILIHLPTLLPAYLIYLSSTCIHILLSIYPPIQPATCCTAPHYSTTHFPPSHSARSTSDQHSTTVSHCRVLFGLHYTQHCTTDADSV